jgi:myosin heavy subunit
MQQFLATWVWTLSVALVVAAAVVGLRTLGIRVWAEVGGGMVAAGAVVVSLLAAVGWVVWRGPSRLEVARTLDRLFGLEERLSTVVGLPAAVCETPAGRAVVRDAARRVAELEVRERLRLARPPRLWLPIGAAVVFGVVSLLPERLLARRTAEAAASELSPEQRERAERVIRKVGQSVAEKRTQQLAQPEGQTGRVLAELERALDRLAQSPPADKQQALVALNQLASTIQDRRQQVGGLEQLSRQLEQLKEMAGGPAGQFGRELARGNYSAAAQQLQTLREKLNSGEMSASQQQELARQLDALRKQIERMADLEQQRKLLEDARKNGLITEQQYQEQKARLDQQAEDLRALQDLARRLGKAQQELAAGQMRQAAQTLSSLQEQLEEMAATAQEIEALDGALADLQDAKQALADDSLNQIGQTLEGVIGQGLGNQFGRGVGLSRGRGQGDRPEAPDDTSAYNTKVRQQVTKGKAFSAGFTDPSRQVRGQSILESQEAVEAAASQAAEALVDQRIPQSMRKHVQHYFDRVRTGP